MSDTTWNLFVELRKELLETQKILAKMLVFKIAFVTVLLGLIASYIHDLHNALLVIPAFAAMFLDFIIISYCFSIKRISAYTRECIEPALKESGKVPKNFVMWQQYLAQPKARQHLATYGVFGVTFLSVIVAFVALFPVRTNYSLILILALLVFVFMDIFTYYESQKLGKNWSDENLDSKLLAHKSQDLLAHDSQVVAQEAS